MRILKKRFDLKFCSFVPKILRNALLAYKWQNSAQQANKYSQQAKTKLDLVSFLHTINEQIKRGQAIKA